MQHYELKTTKTAHIYTFNRFTPETTSVWIVLHGYGQMAKYFIRKFNVLPPQHFVIAPEALSRFYVQGYSGRVGANWMTKEDRLTDIDDYIAYLDQVYEKFVWQNANAGKVQINVVGFSQGGATAARWVSKTRFKVDNLILWSCIFPEDVNFPEIEKKALNYYVLYGLNDEFNVGEQVQKMKPILEQNRVNCRFIPFEGNHTIPPDVLKHLVTQFKL